MRISRVLGWGIVIYSISYLAWSGFATYGFTVGWLPHSLAFAILGGISAVAGASLHAATWKDILPYSFAWALCVVVLNSIMSVPVAGWSIFVSPYVWVSYAIVVIAPLFFSERFSVSREFSKWNT